MGEEGCGLSPPSSFLNAEKIKRGGRMSLAAVGSGYSPRTAAP